jgi:hypothetical protein
MTKEFGLIKPHQEHTDTFGIKKKTYLNILEWRQKRKCNIKVQLWR